MNRAQLTPISLSRRPEAPFEFGKSELRDKRPRSIHDLVTVRMRAVEEIQSVSYGS